MPPRQINGKSSNPVIKRPYPRGFMEKIVVSPEREYFYRGLMS